jgi:CheY-like chemotaxis protein
VIVLGVPGMNRDLTPSISEGGSLASEWMPGDRPTRRLSNVPNNKILIIEDDPDVRLGFQVLLKAHHYETFFAANAVAALAQSREHNPDLIILDLGLPAIDGFDLLDHLGPLYVSMVPVIVVSGRDVQKNKERALNAGAMAYLQKPWDDEELLDVIDRYSADPSYTAGP